MHIYPWLTEPSTPPPVKHRSLENYYYAKYILHIEECTYTEDRHPPPTDDRSMQHHYTN